MASVTDVGTRNTKLANNCRCRATGRARLVSGWGVASGTSIKIDQAAQEDALIRSRIADIYAELPDLAAVTVSVNAGVVSLSGEVANDSNAARAVGIVGIAERVDGVVTVGDSLQRTLELRTNIRPLLEDLTAKAERWLRAIPLFIAASLVFLVIAYAGTDWPYGTASGNDFPRILSCRNYWPRQCASRVLC